MSVTCCTVILSGGKNGVAMHFPPSVLYCIGVSLCVCVCMYVCVCVRACVCVCVHVHSVSQSVPCANPCCGPLMSD